MKRLSLTLLLCLAAPFTWAGDKGDKSYKNAGSFEVEAIRGISYFEADGVDPVRNQLDLYLPKGQNNFPVLMFVHGGFWKSGNKDLYEPIGRLYAKNGIGTVIINYRLSPKYKHPAHIEDVARAFAWTHNNIAKYGGNPDNIFVSGHSAGGHLVALLSTNETYLKEQKLSLANIKGTIALSGVYVMVPNELFKPMFTMDKAIVKSASPIDHVVGHHPPCLLLYADNDMLTLAPQAEQMCKKMSECGCDVLSLKIPQRTHISIITSMVNESDPANQAIFEFLAKHGGLKLKEVKK